MIISVASGKGGTGKTTVAISLASSLGQGVTLLDCDVEEPNCHLFLRPQIVETEEVATMVPAIRQEACSGCKRCAGICRFRALTVVSGKVLVFPELCHGCGGCLAICPEGAIESGKRLLGTVETGRCGDILFRHGRLRIGEAMAPPLIRQVRAGENGAAITIIDAPPGTSCPVITAMRGTDFVLLVTEPTPFGLHDLSLAVEAVQLLGIPCGLVINRSDLGDQGVKAYARRQGLPVLMEIPYDREIAGAYSCGIPIVQAMPEWVARFRRLYEKIVTLTATAGRTQ